MLGEWLNDWDGCESNCSIVVHVEHTQLSLIKGTSCVIVVSLILHGSKDLVSAGPGLCAPLGEKWCGEQSQISWAYYPER